MIEEKGIEPNIVEYLNAPPSEAELESILTQLAIEPDALMRKGEDEYKEHFKGKTLSRAQTIRLMIQHPKVIERPIVVSNGKAAVGRPPESVLDIL